MAEDIYLYLGNDCKNGEAVKVNLSRANSAILAGSSGSGKSTLIHQMLVSLISRKSPNNLELWLGDPKLVEFASYEDIPHVKMIANTAAEHEYMLKHLCDIMDSRYEWMKARRIKNAKDTFMSNIILSIDEFSDITLNPQFGKSITRYVTRLTQLGRAACINCIIATQHPTVQVVSSSIKANSNLRICMKVMTAMNSRVVIDRRGGEKLRGNGHMLVLDSSFNNGIVEVQAPLFPEAIMKRQYEIAKRRYGKRMEVCCV